MPWCPQCRSEYQEGFTTCKDCKVDLVDNLEEAKVEHFVAFFQTEDLKIADRLSKFFDYSELDNRVEYNEEYEVYILLIPPKMETAAKKLYDAFYEVERERLIEEVTREKELLNTPESMDTSLPTPDDSEYEETCLEDAIEDTDMDDSDKEDARLTQEDTAEDNSDVLAVDDVEDTQNTVYVMKADEYKDLAGTVIVFLVAGVAGLIFVLLNLAGIISLFHGWFTNSVMAVLFCSFLVVAAITSKRMNQVRKLIDKENLMTRDLNNWLKENVTADFFESNKNDEISEEANYIMCTNLIKELLLKEFGSQNSAYLERVIEDYYNRYIEEDGE